jgi:hypothetical protein
MMKAEAADAARTPQAAPQPVFDARRLRGEFESFITREEQG